MFEERGGEEEEKKGEEEREGEKGLAHAAHPKDTYSSNALRFGARAHSHGHEVQGVRLAVCVFLPHRYLNQLSRFTFFFVTVDYTVCMCGSNLHCIHR